MTTEAVTARVARLRGRLRAAEETLRHEVREEHQQLRRRLRRGAAWFDEEMQQAHRRLRQSIPEYVREGSLLNLLTAPVIYALVVPFLLLDVAVTAYQVVCFPIYGIALVSRSAYCVLDRHQLAYLNGIEKVNCTYCSYVNGLFGYVREVAARTEQFWCPIKHAAPILAPHRRYRSFFDFGDAARYRRSLPALRRALRRDRGSVPRPRP
jgi:hypothetical protein